MSKEKKPLTERQLEQRRAAGRALVAARGSDYMRAIGKTGYFNAGAKYGFAYVNEKVFGAHYPKSKARKLLLTDMDATQPRLYLISDQ
jgi:hypothetical protein